MAAHGMGMENENLPSLVLSANQWKVPLALALAVHFITFGVTMLPSLLNLRPRLPEVYTVELFNAAEIAAPARPALPITPRKTKMVKQPAPPPAAKAVSLNPRKPKPHDLPDKDKDLEKARLAKAAAIRAKALQKEEADRAAREAVRSAVSALRSTIRAGAIGKTATRAPGPATVLTGGGQLDEARKRYYAAIILQINDHWSLPDLQNWPDSLEAVLVIRVRRDGIVSDLHFEKESDNIYFNQFTLKAVRDSSPLPPFPPQFKEREMEIGLRFRPGDLM